MRPSLQAVWPRRPLGLFGPVLFYDLVRQSRRSRYILLRCLYAFVLAFILYWLYYHTFVAPSTAPRAPRWTARTYVPGRGMMPGGPPVPQTPNRVLLTAFAEEFFNRFMVLQFTLVLVLTPVYAASSITEEKERKTLEHLLATDLSDREIILSKVVARFANLALIVLAGLPILSVVQFLGGIDPGLVLAGFAATVITMVSITAVSVLASVYARKSRDAVLLTYAVLGVYTALGYLVLQVQKAPWAAAIGVSVGGRPVTLFECFNAGNLPVVLGELQAGWAAGKSLADLVSGMLWQYLSFHALTAACCTWWSMRCLRKRALEQSSRPAVSTAVVVPRPRIRPRLALQPMVWKEVFIEPVYRPRRLMWMLFVFLVVLSLVPGLWIYVDRYLDYWLRDVTWMTPPTVRGLWAADADEWNSWARLVATTLASLLLLAVAARASTSISGERDRDTLDALLAAPLRSHDILFGKWLGSLLSVRWGWLWLGTIWAIGIATGGLHPVAAPLSVVLWLVYASFLAGLGLWFSVVCRSSLRALLYTLGAAVLLYGGTYVGVWALYYFLFPLPAVRWLASVLTGIQSAFTPPVVFYWVGASPRELHSLDWEMKVLGSLFCLFLWALASLLLWTITRSRFRRITSRMPYRRTAPPSLLVDSWGPTAREAVLEGSVASSEY
jgi:ABC-type Na+ efflux pump permease subunit